MISAKMAKMYFGKQITVSKNYAGKLDICNAVN
jgi:hypothetical protein